MSSLGSKGQPQFVGGDTVTIAKYLTQLGNYAALVGNSITGTAAQRSDFTNQFGFNPFDGLEYRETDTRNRYLYTVYGWVGNKSQTGAVEFNTAPTGGGNGGYSWTSTVAFVPGRFTSPPIVTTGIFSTASANQHAGVANVTTSSFTLYFWRENTTATTVGWAATPID